MGGSESPIQVCVPGWRSSSGVSRYMKTNDAAGRLHVEVGDLQRIVIDKRAPRFHHIAHQRRKNLVCRDGILDSDLQQATGLRIDRGIPQLLRFHFTQPLETLDRTPLLGFLKQPDLRSCKALDAWTLAATAHAGTGLQQTIQLPIGRASCRESVCQYV